MWDDPIDLGKSAQLYIHQIPEKVLLHQDSSTVIMEVDIR